jgi:hypothetical protein
MGAMKRRIVYMDDETWERLRAVAQGQRTTISELLRRASLPPYNHLVISPETSPQSVDSVK